MSTDDQGNLGPQESEVKSSPMTADDWAELSNALTEHNLIPQASEISKLQGYSESNLQKNTEAGLSAVLHSLSVDDAKILRNFGNFKRFTDLLDKFKQECINGLKDLEEITPQTWSEPFSQLGSRCRQRIPHIFIIFGI
jgi:hypothetical protein